MRAYNPEIVSVYCRPVSTWDGEYASGIFCANGQIEIMYRHDVDGDPEYFWNSNVEALWPAHTNQQIANLYNPDPSLFSVGIS